MTSTIGFASITAFNAANAFWTIPITPASFGIIVMIVPTAEMTFPTMISTGPIAAATSAMVTITFLVPSSIELSQSTNFWIHPTIIRTVGISSSPKEIASSSSCDFNICSWPARFPPYRPPYRHSPQWRWIISQYPPPLHSTGPGIRTSHSYPQGFLPPALFPIQ